MLLLTILISAAVFFWWLAGRAEDNLIFFARLGIALLFSCLAVTYIAGIITCPLMGGG